MKFLLDENVDRGLFSFLVESGHDVKLSPKGIKNGQVSEISIKEERILISRDIDFLETSKYFGIILIRVPSNDLEMQKRAIVNLLKHSSEIRGRIVLLSSDKTFEIVR